VELHGQQGHFGCLFSYLAQKHASYEHKYNILYVILSITESVLLSHGNYRIGPILHRFQPLFFRDTYFTAVYQILNLMFTIPNC